MQQSKFFSAKRISLLIIFAFIAFNLGLWLGHLTKKPISAQVNGTLLPQPRVLNSFELTDGKNQLFTNQNLIGHWTLLFFGFTNCSNICPTTMNILNQVYNKLEIDKEGNMPQIVFVSIDPERDTLARIQQYVTGFNPNFQGTTGTTEQLDELTRQLSILYMKVKSPNATPEQVDDYQIDHSGSILLIDPIGRLYAIFSMPHNADSIAKDFEVITAHYS